MPGECRGNYISVLWTVVILAVPIVPLYLWRCYDGWVDAARSRSIANSGAELRRNIEAIKNGETTFLRFYDTVGTDDLLKRVSSADDVSDDIETIYLGLTDVSDNGLRFIGEVRNLKRLIIYGGSPGISDVGLSHLQGHPRIRELQLKNTHVTLAGIERMVLPELKSLQVYDDWCTPEAIRRLRDAFPGATVNRESHPKNREVNQAEPHETGRTRGSE